MAQGEHLCTSAVSRVRCAPDMGRGTGVPEEKSYAEELRTLMVASAGFFPPRKIYCKTYFITFLKFLPVILEMNLTKHKEEKRMMNKVSLADTRNEEEHYGAAPAFLQYWVSVTSPLLARPHYPSQVCLGAPRMGTYLFKTSRIPWKEKKMQHMSMCCSWEGSDG